MVRSIICSERLRSYGVLNCLNTFPLVESVSKLAPLSSANLLMVLILPVYIISTRSSALITLIAQHQHLQGWAKVWALGLRSASATACFVALRLPISQKSRKLRLSRKYKLERFPTWGLLFSLAQHSRPFAHFGRSSALIRNSIKRDSHHQICL